MYDDGESAILSTLTKETIKKAILLIILLLEWANPKSKCSLRFEDLLKSELLLYSSIWFGIENLVEHVFKIILIRDPPRVTLYSISLFIQQGGGKKSQKMSDDIYGWPLRVEVQYKNKFHP